MKPARAKGMKCQGDMQLSEKVQMIFEINLWNCFFMLLSTPH